jgi:serine phosphatase RsbU (regulator of sigma subunit)/ligand-binding sensor domain-containing protein
VSEPLVRELRARPGLILAWGFLAAACAAGAGAQEHVAFEHLSVKQGLSQADVNCILQDSRGFMWLGTQDGLNRFDGYGFRVYRHDPDDPRSLNDSWIVSLAETPDGTLWVGTRGNPHALNRFDPLGETFAQVPADSAPLDGARTNAIRPSYQDPFGDIWSGTIGNGLIRRDPRTGKVTVYRHDPADRGSLADDRVSTVAGDHLGGIWVGTQEGLDRFDRKSGSFVHFIHDEKDPNSLSDNWVWPLCEDRTGVLWVGTMRGGLNRFDRTSGRFTRYRHDESDPKSISDDRLYSIYQDASGMIWVGTAEHGVDRFNPSLAAFDHYAHTPSHPSSLINDNVISAFVTREGIPWIGTRGGLERLDRSSRTFTHFTHDPSDPRSIADNTVECIEEDGAGLLWLGTFAGGLDRFDPRTGTSVHFRHDASKPEGLSDNRVYALCEDRSGVLWVGTYGGGLNRFDPASGTFRCYAHNDSVPGSLGAPGVFALCEDHEGTIWVGTFGGGLDRFDSAAGTFAHFRHDDADPGSLSNDLVACIYEDRSGTLWAGTAGGLNRLDRSSGKFRRYTQKDGLPDDVIYGILGDDRGNLWMSTGKGISQLDPRNDLFRNYDVNDGLQGNEFNQGAYGRDPVTGELYFGGGNGFNLFQPDSVRRNTYVPPVVFSSFIRYNNDDKDGKPIEEKGVSAKPEIVLSYKDNVAIFEFAALNYYNTFKNQYAYRLEGYNDNWIRIGADHRATFTNLDGGRYTLHVRGSNNDGVWNDDGASLRIVIAPPWWRTRWAYASYALLFLVSLYLIRRFEMNRQAQKTQVRESDLRAKAAEAEKRALQAENERKSRELEDARQLQLSMLPRELPERADLDIAVYMKTATEVGGDFYDFSTDADGSLSVAFGDATGHGMQAGTIVTLMKGLFVSDAARFDIQAFLHHSSRAIKEIKLGRLFMAFSLLRLRGRRLSFSSAGMPPLFLFRRSDGSVEEILLKGMTLGAMKSFPYALHEEDLMPGDTILLLTDGLPEQKDASGEMFDYARVHTAFAEVGGRPTREIISRLVLEAEGWLKGKSPDDDMTLLVIKMKDNGHSVEGIP